MDKFKALEPVKLYGKPPPTEDPAPKLVGRLPADLHILVLDRLPVPDIPAYSRCSRATADLARDERVWKSRWTHLGVEKHGLHSLLDDLDDKSKGKEAASKAAAPPTLAVDNLDDDFGDFTSVNVPSGDEIGDFVGSFSAMDLAPRTPFAPAATPPTFKSMYARAHRLLKPFSAALSSPPHLLLSSLFPPPAPSLRHQSHLLRLLSAFLSPRVQPLRDWPTFRTSLRLALDRFDANLITAFDVADSNHDEKAMREAADASWNIWEGPQEWELGKVWADKREIFYEHERWKPLDNFTSDGELAFDAMDELMNYVLASLREHGARAVRVFPPQAGVLLSFADRIAADVIGEYVASLLTRARELSNQTFLVATAASFKEAWKMVDVLMDVSKDKERPDGAITQTQAEDVVYQMFEANMDEYLDEEIESVKLTFDGICKSWEEQIQLARRDSATFEPAPAANGAQQPHFLGSQNPAQMKRTVLASFTDVLLLPVTIVPRTVNTIGAGLTTAGSAAVQGISMLNPQRWGGGGVSGSEGHRRNNYTRDFGKPLDGEGVVFELGDEADAEDEVAKDAAEAESVGRPSLASTRERSSTAISSRTSLTSVASSRRTAPQFDHLELLLSLDVALELIHADRESLKRVETFVGYPGHYGHRVHDTLEEIFVLVLQAMSERHVCPGFERATEQMRLYRPGEHEETTSVAPLLQFFELVHIGDTIQSMVQVYFDKELAHHIDRTDFLNAVVREKKRFENALDDSVAGGLNAGTEVLMNQVEHIIITRTQARAYYPPEDAPPLELGPTKGCVEAIKCLDMHCRLLKGSTSKEVLEVFYQEVGFRLIAILQKHIKRQIISLQGGFQIIADLNAYYAFIASLKVPSITAEFSHLKMLGHVYVVEDARDLAQIVRDVTRYGGAYRPEDIYEFIQRRADWKKIEKTVDKTMYNLSFKEDCVIC